ncbi:MAG: DUF1287 domain-containing protein [Magnetospiraceae bacterium]
MKFYSTALILLLLGTVPAHADTAQALSDAALERTNHRVIYDGAYQSIPYPGGDVAADRGVCTDVVVRSYRSLGIDLQKAVHEDMRGHFSAYPKNWGLTRPDRNIDHRRVLNLKTFLKRRGAALPVSENPADFKPGDLVTWRLSNGLPHMGVVVDKRSADGKRPMIVHNIGAGPRLEDFLFGATLTGHYRWLPE